MKGIIWNSDGFGDTAKHFALQEAIRENKLAFTAVLETGRSNFSAPFLRQISGVLSMLGTPYHRMAVLVVFWPGLMLETFWFKALLLGNFVLSFKLKIK